MRDTPLTLWRMYQIFRHYGHGRLISFRQAWRCIKHRI